MRFKHLIKTSVCALILLSAVQAQAADDVYVDLSVLNDLQPGDTLFVETQPLFPVIKQVPARKAVKKKAAKKNVKKTAPKKKTAPVKVEVEDTETGKSIVIKPQMPEIPQPLAEVKVQEPITVPEAENGEREEVARVSEPLPSNEETAAAPVSAVQSEELKPLEQNEAEEAAAPVVAETTETPETVQEMPEKELSAPVPVVLTPETPQSSSAAAPGNGEVIKPLIPTDNQAVSASSEKQIMFDDGDYAVSPQNAEKIISLIEGFEDPHKHKIAIYAYNYDNGENSFKKKKLSLDRATEIRSLLLGKGYKNFSIKVINVTDAPEKRNLVEIEEIK